MQFFGVINGVFRYFDRDVGLRQKSLATQAGIGLQSPSAVEQIFFALIHIVERLEAFANDDMACGTGTAQIAGMLDINFMVQERFANRSAGRC